MSAVRITYSEAERIIASAGRVDLRTITRINEEWWYWPTSPLYRDGDSGWWMIPPRVADRARRLIAEARLDRRDRYPTDEAVTGRLRQWRRSGRWRRRCLSVGTAGSAQNRRASRLRAP